VARSTRRDERPGPETEGGRVVLALVLGLALLAGSGYAGAYLMAGDKVPVGTTVAGVDIGGKDPSSAERVLRDRLASRAETPFTVVINGRSQQVRPSQVGLSVDYAASVGKTGAGRSWRPSRLWSYFSDGASRPPVVRLDQDRLARLLRRLDITDGRTPTDGGVVCRHQTFTIRPPRPGLTLDPRATGAAFWNAYLAPDPLVELRMSPVEPRIGTATIDRFVKHFANPAMASSVELRFGETSVHVSPAAYGDLLAARRVGDTLRPSVDAQAVRRLTDAQLTGAPLRRPVPATVALVDGRPQVVRARPGVTYRARDIASALLRAIASKGRTASVRPTPAKASFTDADARRLGIRGQIGQFTVRLPRRASAGALASVVGRLDGTVLKPGHALSLRGLLGGGTPRGAAGTALATAVFNAAWLGGLRVTAHATSASYAGDVAAGRDATLRKGQDLAFTDDSRYGVLVSAVEGRGSGTHHRSLTVTLWSTPRWRIVSTGDRTHVVAAGRHVERDHGCTPRAGRDGFEVTVTRKFFRDGRVDHRSSYLVSYRPVKAVVCRARHHHRHH
jgi:hypothetical protein